MTPLEELQAAHKRLIELRGPWFPERQHRDRWRINAEIDGYCEIGMAHGEIVSTWRENGPEADLPVSRRNADLIVILHRTIDAQLSLLDVAYGTLYEDGNRSGTFLVTEALRLARAINGGAS